jgi:cell shape-determining protein MreC
MRVKSTRSPAPPETGRGTNEDTRAALSKRIWVILSVLTGLLIYTGIGMVTARGQLDDVTSALQQAEARAKETGLKLTDALADKQEILKEISAQGQRIAASSQAEEKARAALATASFGAQTAEKNIAARNREIADLKTRLSQARTASRKAASLKAEVKTLKEALREARSVQDNTMAEVERLRAVAEPYSQTANPAARQSQ